VFIVNGIPTDITAFTLLGVVCLVPICHFLLQMSLECRRAISVACQKSQKS
jgi:hypothetical protein